MSSSADDATLILRLEEYLGRLIDLVDGSGSAGQPTASTNTASTAGPSASVAPFTPAVWLADAGEPPDDAAPKFKGQMGRLAAQVPPNPEQGAATAENFLRNVDELIRAFLTQQQQQVGPPAVSQEEAEARAEVLRRAAAAADAAAAARGLRAARSQHSSDHSGIVRQIDRQWTAALGENDALRAQLGEAMRRQQELRQAKELAQHRWMEKELILKKIRLASVDLKQELVKHKLQLQQKSRAAAVPHVQQEEQKAIIQKLQQGIVDLESQLQYMHSENKGLEEDLQRTHGEKEALESQLNYTQAAKQELESELQRTRDALNSHQHLRQALDHTFQNAETEVQGLRRLLKQLDTSAPPSSDLGGGPSGGQTPSRSNVAPPATSAFQPTTRLGTHQPSAPASKYGVDVETVYSEPEQQDRDGTVGGHHYQQNLNPSTWPKQLPPPAGKPSWPKPHPWDTTPTLYHVEVPAPHGALFRQDPQGHGLGLGPEWTQQMPKEKLKPNWDPPAGYASIDGDSETPRQQQPWRQAEPAAPDETGSYAYTTSAVNSVGVQSHPMPESIAGESYYGSMPGQHGTNAYFASQRHWNDANVTEEHAWSVEHRRTPQEPEMAMKSTAPPEPLPGPMAFLQEQMANAVDDARNNPKLYQGSRFFSGEHPPSLSARLPLQPAAVGRESPERVVVASSQPGRPMHAARQSPPNLWR